MTEGTSDGKLSKEEERLLEFPGSNGDFASTTNRVTLQPKNMRNCRPVLLLDQSMAGRRRRLCTEIMQPALSHIE